MSGFRKGFDGRKCHHCSFCKTNFLTLREFNHHYTLPGSCKNQKLDADKKRESEDKKQQLEAMEKEKQAERDRAARQEREAVEALEREENETLAMQERLKSSLPSELASTDKDIITICLRSPTGDQHIRRFRMNEPVKWLVVYSESLGFNMETYRLFTSDVPKKDVAILDNNKSFRELKWPPRELITVAEK